MQNSAIFKKDVFERDSKAWLYDWEWRICISVSLRYLIEAQWQSVLFFFLVRKCQVVIAALSEMLPWNLNQMIFINFLYVSKMLSWVSSV